MARRSILRHLALPVAVVCLVGLVITGLAYIVVRKEVDGLEQQRIAEPAKSALLSVDNVVSAVDQVLATADGVIVAAGHDPARFSSALAPDVLDNPALTGIALVVDDAGSARVTASVGDTPLLEAAAPSTIEAGRTTRLVAHQGDEQWSHLAFAARAPDRTTVVYVEIQLPREGAGESFALVVDGADGRPEILLGNAATTTDLTRTSDRVSFGGREASLFVHVEAVERGWFGIPLPAMALLVGLVLTALSAVVVVSVLRRKRAVEALGAENRALDEALERQREVEAELRASQERFRTILRDSPDAIALLDLDRGTCEVLNRSEFLGHTPEALQAEGALFALVHPDERVDADAHWDRLQTMAPEVVGETTLRFRTADGEDRYLRLRSSQLGGNSAENERVQLALLSDVTDEWLNQMREAELEEALRRSQRRESLGALAGGIAHDFNNILAVVLACSEMLIDDIAPAHREYATEIKDAATRGADLVRQLLTFAQRDCAHPQPVDFNDVLRGMEPLLRRTLGEQIQLQISLSELASTVVADPVHLEQVILNLAVNARDAMPAGGILWVSTTAASSSDDRDPRRSGCVVMSVSDSGTGIDPAIRDRIFDPFVTTKDPAQGTGLGLSTVFGIVDSLGGHINLFSEPGLGTTFEIVIPGAGSGDDSVPPAVVAATPSEVEALDGNGRHVLLVEDDDTVRPSLARNLERHGFRVTSVSNGSDALRAVERHAFDVVVTDAIMPGMPGIELVARLRNTRPELPLVLMSGYSQEIFENGELPGAPALLRKPFTTPQLLATLETALAHPTALKDSGTVS